MAIIGLLNSSTLLSHGKFFPAWLAFSGVALHSGDQPGFSRFLIYNNPGIKTTRLPASKTIFICL
jgi:hypothetical protein